MFEVNSDRFDHPERLPGSTGASQVLIQIWEFADAPEALRTQIPLVYADGWLAFIRPGTGGELEQFLVDRWNAFGFSLVRHQMDDGGVLLAGPHLPQSAQNGDLQ
jgi:hypothetical protein